MHIAVDLDDVVMDFWAGVCKSVGIEYGMEIDPEDTKDWDVNTVKGLDVFGEGRTWWDWLHDRNWIWHTFQPIPGAIGGIQQLRQQGHYVEALTKKPEWAEWTVWKWLGKWRPAFNTVTIVPSGSSKAEASTADLLIDDSPDNFDKWVATGRPLVIFRQPWNDEISVAGEVHRARTWSDVLSAVDLVGTSGAIDLGG